MSLFLRLMRMGRKYWGYLGIAILSMLLLTTAQLIPPYLLRNFISFISNKSANLPEISIKIALILLAAYGAQMVFTFLRSYITHVAAWNFVSDLRVKVYEKLQKLSLRYYHDKQTGQILARVANDTQELEVIIAHAVPDLIVSILTLLAVTAILLFINVQLTLYTFITMPFFIFLATRFAKKVFPQFRQAHQVRGEFYALLNDNISGMREIQAFNKQDSEYEKVKDKSRHHITFLLNALKLSAFFHPTMNFAAQIGTVIVVGAGGFLASQDGLPVEDIVAFMLYLNMFYQPLSTLARLNEDLQNSLAAAQRVFDIIDAQPDVKDKPNAITMPKVKGNIQFKNVNFSYVDDIPIIKNLNLDIAAGEMVAFVGQTGVGKTTIVSLINRFYEQKEGQILIDGIDIRDVTLRSLRDNISMVMQDVFLFNGTVAENIAYGVNKASMQKIKEAAKKANADEFIEKLENGYDTITGERGVKLSGGQKQRLAIARAILRDTPILILDEATAAVDTATERLIHQAINEVAKSRTTIIIAHRLATVKNADKIVVLDKGEIVEMGTHDELIKKGGIYTKLCSMQFMS